MDIVFDGRFLTHKNFTGVENYADNLLKNISLHVKVAKPGLKNKYLVHLWAHIILPFLKYRILFCPLNTAPIYLPKNKKLILTLHDVAFLVYPKSFSFFFRWYYKILVPINIKRANQIITISNFSKKQIEFYYPNSKGKIQVIHNGINSNFKNLNLYKKKQILFVGTLNERKNFIAVLQAFKKLKSNDTRLILVGNFDKNFQHSYTSKYILQESQKNSNIVFINNISQQELIRIYNESNILILPSFYEGFGFPLLEAMSCGVPILCSDIEPFVEIAQDVAMYLNPHDTDDIKNKIKTILNDTALQLKMKENGLKRAKDFSWEKNTILHLEVFKKVSNI